MLETTTLYTADENNYGGTSPFYSRTYTYIIGFLILLLLYVISGSNFLLFHSVAEGFSIAIACGIFMVVWNTRQFIDNNFFIVIGVSYLFVAFIDLLHTIAYKGVGVFPDGGTNLASQLWLSARYLQAITFLLATFAIGKKIKIHFVYLFYFTVTAAWVVSIFYYKIFPACFVEGYGLTAYKKISEYVLSALMTVAIFLLYKKRKEFDENILNLVIMSIGFTIISELFFTLYETSYGKFNALGHLFKIISFYLIYKAIIQIGLRNPYNLLFRSLKQKEEALRLTRFSIDRAEDLILWIREDCTFADINDTTCRKLGYSRDKLLTMAITQIDSQIKPLDFKNIWNDLKTKETITTEHKITANDGTIRDMEIDFNHVNFGNKEYCCAFARDITERKKVEEALHESERRFRTLADNAPVLIWMTGVDKLCNYCNKTWLEFSGRSLNEELGYGWTELIHPDDKKYCMDIYNKMFDERKDFSIEYRMKRRDGQYRWLMDTGVPRFTHEGNFLGYVGSSLDITEQKNYREQIETSLKEKVVLLKEIHHRVKNNLQVISSLFRLQAFSIKDADARNAFIESQNRVKSMALIHEKLYLSKNLSQVNFSEYIHELITNMLASFMYNSNTLDLVINIDEIDMSVDMAINLGLIVNELVSNTYKYAFPDGAGANGERCKLMVILKNYGNTFSLTIKDNGIGLPPNFNINQVETLGLQLVASLVQQHNGTIEINTASGTEFTFNFSKKFELEKI